MKNKAAVTALLEIYQNAVSDFKTCIATISDENLIKIIDTTTSDTSCRSLQTILSHVVNSGYSYATSIYNYKGNDQQKPVKEFHLNVASYKNDLDKMLSFTQFVFEHIYDDELEVNEENSKMKTGWGQYYDIEQLMEHAIVHILRHLRQINTIIKDLS